jgi:hypothetical protein
MERWVTRAEELKRQGRSWAELPLLIEQEFGIRLEREHIRSTLRRLPTYKNRITYEDKKPVPEIDDINEYYSKLKELNKAIDDLDTKQVKTTITIDETKPIGIAFWGDWHIGARGIDYERFDQDRETIKNTDGLYIIGMGDYKDNQNALVHPSGVTEMTAVPGLQDLLVKSFFVELAEKWLAIIRGCHDDWDKRLSDKDFVAMLAEETNSVNLWHGGGITLKLGSQQYKIRARHKYKNESGLNTTNSQRNLLNDFGDADILALAHKHFFDLQETDRMGRHVIYLRSGTYKVYDEHGQKLAGYIGKHGVPMVILYPDTKKMVPFKNLEDGITHLKAIRGN